MLQNAYFLANIGADTAENEQHYAKKLPNICQNWQINGGVLGVSECGGAEGGPRACTPGLRSGAGQEKGYKTVQM